MGIKEEIEKAISLREQGKLAEAVEAYHTVAKLLEKEGHILDAANAYLEMGLLLNESGDDEKALKWHKKAFMFFNENKDERMADAAYNLCVTLVNLGNYKDALKYGLTSLQIYKKLDNEDGMADANYALALAKMDHSPEESIDNLNKALKIYTKLKNKEGVSSVHIELGNIFLTIDKLEEAMAHFKKALSLYKTAEDREGMASTLVNIAELHEINDKYRDAAFNFVKASEKFIECDLPDLAEEFIARTDSLISELPKSTRRTVRKKLEALNEQIKEKGEM